jgi:hypothetical protein
MDRPAVSFQTPGFSPGPSPDDWADLEARRIERTQRAHNAHGRDMSPRTRTALQVLFIAIGVAIVVITVLAVLGVIAIPGIGPTPVR